MGALNAGEKSNVIPDHAELRLDVRTFASAVEAVPNHNPRFASVPQPTLRTGAEAAVTAAFSSFG